MPEEITSTTWWHSSSSKIDFPNLTPSKYMHLGTLRAAIDNEPRIASSDGPSYLYSVRLKPQSNAEYIHPDIFVETDGNTSYEMLGCPMTHAIHRYVNIREDPGSLSLVVLPEAIESVMVCEEKMFSHWDRPRYSPAQSGTASV